MLLLQPPQLLSFLLTLLSSAHTVHARPKISDELRELLDSRYHYLSKRQCANPCGWSGQVCCGSGQTCSTNSLGQAVCLAGSGSGSGNAQAADAPGGETYTTTIVESGLLTRTTTYSRYFGPAPTSAAAAQISGISCAVDMGEKPCGTICCAVGQYCVYAGQCGSSNDQAGESSSVLGQIFVPSATNTPPLRPTSNAATTVTRSGSVTTTVRFTAATSMAASASAAGGAAGVTESNNGLSGGAIAGIVIGVLAGIILLILLIFCFCAATVGNAILAALGCGRRRKRKTEVTYIEEHSHHHSGGGAAVVVPQRRWYGLLPPKKEVVVEKKKKKSGVGGFTAVTAGLGTLAVVLGLKRKMDKKTEYSGSSYTYSDYSYYDSEYTSNVL